MRNNLLILHLESISNTILWQYRVELGTVWRLMRESRRYTRFHSNATSTEMVKSCFHFGSHGINDYKAHFRQPHTEEYLNHYLLPKCPYIRDYLVRLAGEPGIEWKVFVADVLFRKRQTFIYAEFYPTVDQTLAAVSAFMDRIKAEGKRFALYFDNPVTHMAVDDGGKARAATFSERFRQGYVELDASINRVLSLLTQKGLWDETTIIAYGDHGDELWSHGLNKGYCHSIAPYASLTRTPMFIHESGVPPADDAGLAQTIDVKRTLFRDYDANAPHPDGLPPLPPFDSDPFVGADVCGEGRKFAFSQNLHALQMEYDDPEQGLAKGYAVSDGVYRLVVLSGGRRPKEGGMELYCDRLDPSNSRNLLDFFRLDPNGGIAAFQQPAEAVDPAFAHMFNPAAVGHIIETYETLRRELVAHVRAKEEYFLPFAEKIKPGEWHRMPESAFRHARKRLRRDYDE